MNKIPVSKESTNLSLLCVASKIVSSVIATRLGKHFLDVGLDEQCGGVLGKGCIDGTYNVKQALHTLSQHGADSYVIFADLVKAYDTVDRELLMKIMARYGCPEELIFVLRKLYSDITVQLKGCGKGVTIPSTVGVKQGDNLAPVLFIFLARTKPRAPNHGKARHYQCEITTGFLVVIQTKALLHVSACFSWRLRATTQSDPMDQANEKCGTECQFTIILERAKQWEKEA